MTMHSQNAPSPDSEIFGIRNRSGIINTARLCGAFRKRYPGNPYLEVRVLRIYHPRLVGAVLREDERYVQRQKIVFLFNTNKVDK
jgi:hypothetical protein